MALVKKITGTPSVVKNVEAQRKKARTLAKQQQAAERIAAAAQPAAGINEAASAAEELKRASDSIATGAGTASAASQESLAAFQQVEAAIARQLQNADLSQTRMEATQALVAHRQRDCASRRQRQRRRRAPGRLGEHGRRT